MLLEVPRDDHPPLLQCTGCRVCACVGHRCQAGKRPGLAYPSSSYHRAVRGWRADRLIARIVGERLSKSWDQQVLIENRPGGGTNIANELVARSDPDGHTVLMGGSSQAATRGLYPSLSYDPIGDFAPVAFLCSFFVFMFVPNSLP